MHIFPSVAYSYIVSVAISVWVEMIFMIQNVYDFSVGDILRWKKKKEERTSNWNFKRMLDTFFSPLQLFIYTVRISKSLSVNFGSII